MGTAELGILYRGMGRNALVMAALCTAVAAQELKPYEDATKVFRVDLPATWQVQTRRVKETLPLRFKIRVPDAKGPVHIDLYAFDGVQLTSRAQARFEQPAQVERWKATASGVSLHPLPHLRLDYKDKKGERRMVVHAYKRQLCRGLVLVLMCLKSDWPKVSGGYLNAAQGMSSTLGRYPAIPDDYERTEHAGFVYLSAPGVRRKARKRVEKIVAETQKWFVKLHGPITRPPSEPPLVFLHTLQREAGRLNRHAAVAEHGHLADVGGRAIYAVPVQRQGSRQHASLVAQIHRLLFAERYGLFYPAWVQAGENALFVERVETGKKWPCVTKAWRKSFLGVQLRLDALEPIHETTDWEFYVCHGMAYTLLFRCGPPEYRKAFGAFLKALATHGDWDRALKHHLFVLDQDKAMRDANTFLERRVKPVEPRR